MFDFKKNTKLPTLDDVPPQFKGLYAQVDSEGHEDHGAFIIADYAKGAVEAVMGQDAALVKSRKEAKSLKDTADMSPLEKWGESATEVAAKFLSITEDFETRLADGNDAKINLDKYKEERDKGHTVEKQAWEKKYNALYVQLEENIVTREAVSAIAAEGGKPKLLLPFVKSAVKLAQENGEFRPYVVDAAGDRRFSPTSGNDLTIAELVTEMKADTEYGPLFTSPKQEHSGGAGTPPSSTVTPNKTGNEQTGMSSMDKISAGLRQQGV